MKRFCPLLVGLALVFAHISLAQDQSAKIREMQAALKDAGFYYGPISGQANTETTAAVRRYQIRNGLEVTGELNQETVDALSSGNNSPAQSQPPPAVEPQPPSVVPQPPVRAVQPPPPAPDRQYGSEPHPSGQVPENEPLIPFAQLYARTPYQAAPLPVQQETLKRVQEKLAKKGFYRGPISGVPTESVRRSIASYQNAQRLNPSGNLDIETLHEMRLLPGESSSGFGTSEARPTQRIYRGIEVR